MNFLQAKDNSPPNLLSVQIISERLALVPISDQFSAEIFREFTGEITRYMLPKPADDIEQIHAFIDVSREKMIAGNELVLAITGKQHREFLGVCGLHGKEQRDTAELGIWLKKSAQGKGLGREAIHTLVNWAQTNLNLSYLTYPVDKDNIPSRKIPESLGGFVISEGLRESMSDNILNEMLYRIDVVDNS